MDESRKKPRQKQLVRRPGIKLHLGAYYKGNPGILLVLVLYHGVYVKKLS